MMSKRASEAVSMCRGSVLLVVRLLHGKLKQLKATCRAPEPQTPACFTQKASELKWLHSDEGLP